MELITKGSHAKNNPQIEQQRPIDGASTATHDDLQGMPDDEGQNIPELPEKQTIVEVSRFIRLCGKTVEQNAGCHHGSRKYMWCNSDAQWNTSVHRSRPFRTWTEGDCTHSRRTLSSENQTSSASWPACRNHAAPPSAQAGSTWRHTQVITRFYSSGVIGHEKPENSQMTKCSCHIWNYFRLYTGNYEQMNSKIHICRQSLHLYISTWLFTTKIFSPVFSSLLSAKFVVNHADVSFHKFCSLRVNILDELVLGSFIHVTKILWGRQNPVNHLYIHHAMFHISALRPPHAAWRVSLTQLPEGEDLH